MPTLPKGDVKPSSMLARARARGYYGPDNKRKKRLAAEPWKVQPQAALSRQDERSRPPRPRSSELGGFLCLLWEIKTTQLGHIG